MIMNETNKKIVNVPDYKIEPSLRMGSWIIMILLLSFILWASFARINEVITAQGAVAPKDQIKVIQHLEGGILEALMVKEGDQVCLA